MYACDIRRISDDADFHAQRGWKQLLYSDYKNILLIKRGKESERSKEEMDVLLWEEYTGVITNYRRGPKSQSNKECLLKVLDVTPKECMKLVGWKVAWSLGAHENLSFSEK